MSNLSTFQLVILSIFGLAVFLGLMIFAGVIPGFRSLPGGTLGTVDLWGPLSAETMNEFLDAYNRANRNAFTIRYTYREPANLERELVAALAANRGPDLVILPADLVYRQADKFMPIPYDSLSLRDFRDTFVEAGEIFLTPAGSVALPFYLDPLVMYYNRTLFSSYGLAAPPATWTSFRETTKAINIVDNDRVIKQTAIAFGEFSNNQNAKDILALLLLQAGTPIVAPAERGYRSVLADNFGGTLSPGQAALDYFTQFADPGKTSYSWNRSLPEARDAFAAGLLATYFGFGSELPAVRAKNPNLNFDLTTVPQRDSGRQLTYARVYGLGILRSSRNLNSAAQVAILLAGPVAAGPFSSVIGLPPARRDLLAKPPTDPAQTVFYRSAIMAASWLDPDPAASQRILAAAAERVTTGRETPLDAITRASRELNDLLK